MIEAYVVVLVVLFLIRGYSGLQFMNSGKEIVVRDKESQMVIIAMNLVFAAIGAIVVIIEIISEGMVCGQLI